MQKVFEPRLGPLGGGHEVAQTVNEAAPVVDLLDLQRAAQVERLREHGLLDPLDLLVHGGEEVAPTRVLGQRRQCSLARHQVAALLLAELATGPHSPGLPAGPSAAACSPRVTCSARWTARAAPLRRARWSHRWSPGPGRWPRRSAEAAAPRPEAASEPRFLLAPDAA